MKNILIMLTVAMGISAQASLLNFANGSKNIEGVNLNQSAQGTVQSSKGASTEVKLSLVGAGLRSKKVLIVNAKVYVAQLFSNNEPAFVRTESAALSSLASNSTQVALKISMLRTVSAGELANSFEEALQANKIPMDGEMKQLLHFVETSADGVNGKSLAMLMVKEGTDATTIYYEDTAGSVKSFVGSAALINKVMSIWLGTPVDKGLGACKASLLQKVY
ncbi:MAG: chalcone isomerase family protein [Pseudobdellovibrio sp.]